MSPPRRRPAVIAFVIIAALTCLGLGWWQWSRFQEAGGTFQNLGYALQWPMFAGFFIYAYRRFIRLEADSSRSDDDATATPDIVAPITEIPAGLLPPRPTVALPDEDPEMAEYNRYLAGLHAGNPQSPSRSTNTRNPR